jgi:hypothetical protein
LNNKPFVNPLSEATLIKNVIFDRVMPTLSPSGWKVLCVAMRDAWGGDDPGAFRDTQAALHIGTEDFKEKTGIEDSDALCAAIEECVEVDYLVRHQIGEDARSGQPVFAYTLNTEFEMRDVKAAPRESLKARTEPAKKDSAFPSPESESAFQALVDFAREMEADPDVTVLREITIESDAAAVLAWIETGREMTHLEKPARFQTAVARLRDKVPPLPMAMLAPEVQPGAAHAGEVEAPAVPHEEPDATGAQELWQATLEALKADLRRSTYRWLEPTHAVALIENHLTVGVPNKRTKEWLEEGMLTATVQETLESMAGKPIEVTFVVNK